MHELKVARDIKIAIITAVITTIIGIVGGVATDLIKIPFTPQPPAELKGVELVDVTPQDSIDSVHTEIGDLEQRDFSQLDIKIRNTGNEASFVKRAEFHVQQIYGIKECIMSCPNCYPTPSTWVYDVQLPSGSTPYVKSVNISQAIEPHGVDRFGLKLSAFDDIYQTNTDLKEYSFLMYYFNLVLVYNEGNEKVESPNILMVIGRNETLYNTPGVVSYSEFSLHKPAQLLGGR